MRASIGSVQTPPKGKQNRMTTGKRKRPDWTDAHLRAEERVPGMKEGVEVGKLAGLGRDERRQIIESAMNAILAKAGADFMPHLRWWERRRRNLVRRARRLKKTLVALGPARWTFPRTVSNLFLGIFAFAVDGILLQQCMGVFTNSEETRWASAYGVIFVCSIGMEIMRPDPTKSWFDRIVSLSTGSLALAALISLAWFRFGHIVTVETMDSGSTISALVREHPFTIGAVVFTLSVLLALSTSRLIEEVEHDFKVHSRRAKLERISEELESIRLEEQLLNAEYSAAQEVVRTTVALKRSEFDFGVAIGGDFEKLSPPPTESWFKRRMPKFLSAAAGGVAGVFSGAALSAVVPSIPSVQAMSIGGVTGSALAPLAYTSVKRWFA